MHVKTSTNYNYTIISIYSAANITDYRLQEHAHEHFEEKVKAIYSTKTNKQMKIGIVGDERVRFMFVSWYQTVLFLLARK